MFFENSSTIFHVQFFTGKPYMSLSVIGLSFSVRGSGEIRTRRGFSNLNGVQDHHHKPARSHFHSAYGEIRTPTVMLLRHLPPTSWAT